MARKFYNRKVKADGMTFDSKTEYERWLMLKDEERRGIISGLQRQKQYEIIPAYTERIKVREKQSNRYLVLSSNGSGRYFLNMKLATAYAKECGKQVFPITHKEPVYKDKVIEKAAHYTADFVYYRNGELIVEDVKSSYTRKEKDYILRRKLMLKVWGIRIKEIIL